MTASPCSFLWWVRRQCRGRKRHQQDGLCAFCCAQGHVHPGVTVPLWQPRSWAYFRCMNLYLASFAFDSLSFMLTLLCFFSLVWRLCGLLSELEGVSYLQSGWYKQDFHLLEWRLEVLGSNTALGSSFGGEMPQEFFFLFSFLGKLGKTVLTQGE